jgi:predicted phosphodiesterase
VRTLIVSDFHLGSLTKRAVLDDPVPRATLARAAADCHRLVLLGDLLELRHGPERDALRAARATLTELGTALGPEREVVIVPGNHDHALLAPWLQRRSRDEPPAPLGLESEASPAPGEALASITSWLAPARVRTAYPGVWLRDDVYATHGHYADLHLTMPTLERLAAGVMGRVVGLGDGQPAAAEDYEAALAPIYAWIHAMAQRTDPERGRSLHDGSLRGWAMLTGPRKRLSLRQRALAIGYPVLVTGLNRAGIGPLSPELSPVALRRAGLRGVAEATDRLGVHADHVVFGHTHRAGPLAGDDQTEWVTRGEARLINSGCWIDEPRLAGPTPRSSPYRAGFCVWVGDSGPPELVNLLD